MIHGIVSILIGVVTIAILIAILRLPPIWSVFVYIGKKIDAYTAWMDRNHISEVEIFLLTVMIAVVFAFFYSVGESVLHGLGLK